MRTAAVSELKGSIRKYLDKVQAGEEVVVTDRGRPIAKLIPMDRNDEELPRELLDLERDGLARIGSRRLPKGFWSLPRPLVRDDRAVRAIIADREESG